jgi:uncharacterized protein YkwD
MLKLLLLLPAVFADDAREMFRLVNEARGTARHCGPTYHWPTKELAWDDRLHKAAVGHARDMAARNYFSHQSPPPDSTSPCDRSVAAGWTRPACAENLAAGHATAKRAVDGLLGSPGHCFNIMDPTLAKLGVGVATGGRYRIYYVQRFGPPEGLVNATVRP